MVKIARLLIMIGALLIPIGINAQFGFSTDGQAERKNIIKKIQAIDPAQIKNNRQLGFELNALAKQLDAEHAHEVEQLQKQDSTVQLPKLNKQETAILLNFVKPKYALDKHAAVLNIKQYLKRYAEVSHDEQVKQELNTIEKNNNNEYHASS